MRKLVAITAAIITLSVAGCSGYPTMKYDYGVTDSDEVGEFTPPMPEPPEEYYEKRDIQLPWSCDWSPTMNEDWHDDVLCSNGPELDRPYLLPDWGFVTQEDIMVEAQRYEDYLNGY
ncbi:MAG: hypothetical protein ACTIJ6_06065 [Leucobacter sp.]